MSAFVASPLGQAVREMLDKAIDEFITTRLLVRPSVFTVAAEAEIQMAEESEQDDQ